MKATIQLEKPTYTLCVGGRTITGMKEEERLGPVLHLKSQDGLEAYVLDVTDPALRLFKLGNAPEAVSLIAGNPCLMSLLIDEDGIKAAAATNSEG